MESLGDFCPIRKRGTEESGLPDVGETVLEGEKENDNGERKREIDIALFMCSNQALFW